MFDASLDTCLNLEVHRYGKVESYEVPEGLYFSKDFEWIKIEATNPHGNHRLRAEVTAGNRLC